MELPRQRGEDGGRSGVSDQKQPSEVGCVGLQVSGSLSCCLVDDWRAGNTHTPLSPLQASLQRLGWETGKSQGQYLFRDKEIHSQAVSESGFVGGVVGLGT